ncbi:hypothetical protein PCL_08670 [Purpureocillium lilacinum]|uniref:Uncharacterized protein n=1 Tax=Purpureocillium lilacinum TaxID=33203 RepID=A0A2U3DQY5_PURLI|nr:hypothetical protein PCL_08670 [Purpureocillium lilacinum]
MGLWTYKRLQPGRSSVSGRTKSEPKRAVASVCPFALLERLQCNTNGPIVQQQLPSASIMAEALDVDALDTDLDEYVFLRACRTLGYVIHPLDGQLPGAEQPTKEQLARFLALLEEEGATETLLNIYVGHPSDYQIQSYETGERAYIGVQMQM